MLYERLFPEGHPYHEHVIGSHEDLKRATLDDVKAFFTRYYVPNHASLAIVGDFDPAATLALVERLYGSIPPGEPRGLAAAPLALPQRRAASSSKTTYAWRGSRLPGPRRRSMPMEMPTWTWSRRSWSDGRNSRLWRRLVHDEALATDVGAWQESRRFGSVFRIDVQAAEGVALDRVETVLHEELDRLRSEAPTAADMARARAGLLKDAVAESQELQARAERLNHYVTYLGDPDRLAWDLGRYRKATAEGVRAAAARFLGAKQSLTLRVVPEDVRPRDTRPADAEPRAFRPAAPEVFTLANGLHVWLMRRAGVPLLAARLVMPGGTRGSAVERAGLPAVAARMLTEGGRARRLRLRGTNSPSSAPAWASRTIGARPPWASRCSSRM